MQLGLRHILAIIISAAFAASAHAFDAEQYIETADTIIKTAKRGKVKDVDKLIDMERELIRLGVEGCLEHAEKNPTDLKLMQLVVLNSQRMRKLSLDDLQKDWIEGVYPTSHGVAIDKLGPKDPAQQFLDMVVRPAAAIIALQNFKKSKNAAMLQRVQEETEKARSGAVAQK